jgi:hypothetical protein
MSGELDLEQKQREEARWRMLRVLDAARPVGANETLIFRVLHDVQLAFTPMQIRRELTYLADLDLVELIGTGTETWSAKLTARGVDIVEYTAPAPASIARPKKYW